MGTIPEIAKFLQDEARLQRLRQYHQRWVLGVQLTRWFGPEVSVWRPLRLCRIKKALPDQIPPTPDPLTQPVRVNPWLFVCGEYQSLSSIHWAMVSGCRATEAVIRELQK